MIGRTPLKAAIVAIVTLSAASVEGAELPSEIAAPAGETIVLQVHAEGAQIYECKADASGHLSWVFREPIAALFQDGKTVGRHYAGPSWEIGGSASVGKMTGHAPGATPKDVAWLRLSATRTDNNDLGPLKNVTTVQRIKTNGGGLQGTCDKAGDLHPEPYSADYIFLQKKS
jgi:hypothetical protein